MIHIISLLYAGDNMPIKYVQRTPTSTYRTILFRSPSLTKNTFTESIPTTLNHVK